MRMGLAKLCLCVTTFSPRPQDFEEAEGPGIRQRESDKLSEQIQAWGVLPAKGAQSTGLIHGIQAGLGCV